MNKQTKADPVKDAVKDHLKKILLPPRKHLSLPPGFEWLAFRTLPAKERLAEFHLSRAGVTAFLPMETKARRITHHSKRMTQVELPLLTRVLFVGFEPEQPKHWQEICHSSLIQGVVAAWDSDGMLRPVPITEVQLHVMLGHIGEMVRTNPRRSFGLGDLVRIKEGAFAGFFSRVEGLRGQKAVVDLHIFGGDRDVNIPLDHLEAA